MTLGPFLLLITGVNQCSADCTRHKLAGFVPYRKHGFIGLNAESLRIGG